MSARPVIDPLRFAKAGERLSGAVSAASLVRLEDRLAGPEGEVHYALSGRVDASGRPELRLEVDASLSLVCQRCLGAFVYPLRIETTLLLARDEAQLAAWEELDPMCDGFVAESHMDVEALVEDEILLGLPMVPTHLEGECPSGDE